MDDGLRYDPFTAVQAADCTTARQILAAPGAGKAYSLKSVTLSMGAAGTMWVEDEDGTLVGIKYDFPGAGVLVKNFDVREVVSVANKILKVKASVSTAASAQGTAWVLS